MKLMSVALALVLLLFTVKLGSLLNALITLEVGVLSTLALLCLKESEGIIGLGSILTFLLVSVSLASIGLCMVVSYSRSFSSVFCFGSLMLP